MPNRDLTECVKETTIFVLNNKDDLLRLRPTLQTFTELFPVKFLVLSVPGRCG